MSAREQTVEHRADAGFDREPDRRSGPGRDRHRERGVALILTLGIIGMLLLIAMAFAFSSRTENAAASVNTDMVRARLLAESGLERAIGALRQASSADVYPGASFYAPSSGAWGTRGGQYLASVNSGLTTDIQEALAVAIPVGAATVDYTPEAELHSNVGWLPITVDAEVIGLLSYLIIDESGKIDPGAVVDTTNTEASGVPASRPGVEPSELALADIGLSAAGANLFREESVGGSMPNSARWFSMVHVARRLTPTQAGLDTLNRALFPRSYDIEAYWDSATPEYLHRFDLANFNWDGVNNSEPVLDALAGAAAPFWSTGVPPVIGANSGGMPWLGTVTSSGTSGLSAADFTRQVAANLVDYCDSGHVATSNFSGSGAAGSATYVGLENVPYINEIQFYVIFFDSPLRVVVQANVELVDVYGDLYNNGSNMAVQVQATYGWTRASANATYTSTFNWGSLINMSGIDYQMTGLSPAVHNLAGTETQITGFQIADVKVVVGDGSIAATVSQNNLWDFVRVRPGLASPTQSLIAAPPGSASWYITSTEADDPRANTFGDAGLPNWANWRPWGQLGSVAATYGTMGAKNSGVNPSAHPTLDLETATDPAANGTTPRLSTAYIRNAPPESLWELGAIHRGERWRTLNLRAYNDGTSATTYGNGDAQLLDQAKMTGVYETAGKVNANSPVDEVWETVLGGVQYGCTYDDLLSGAPLIRGAPGTPLENLATAITTQNAISGSGPWNRRGRIADTAELSNGSVVTQPNDRAQEELIGKIANLLTVRQNWFTVLVTARSVKDIGTVDDGSSSTLEWSAGQYCKVLAEQRIFANVSRDAFRNAFVIDRYEYLEE